MANPTTHGTNKESPPTARPPALIAQSHTRLSGDRTFKGAVDVAGGRKGGISCKKSQTLLSACPTPCLLLLNPWRGSRQSTTLHIKSRQSPRPGQSLLVRTISRESKTEEGCLVVSTYALMIAFRPSLRSRSTNQSIRWPAMRGAFLYNLKNLQ